LGPERVTSLRLSPLTPAQQKRLLDARLGHSDLPKDFYAWAYRHTEGNPLWVEMLIQDLIERGILLHEQGYWRVRPTFHKAGEPEVFQTFFTSVVDRLTDEERILLEHAAVIGETFPEELLAELVRDRWPREEFFRILHGLIHRHRVIEDLSEGEGSHFRFVRVRLQVKLYEAFPPRRRCRLHARIGTWFLDHGAEAAALEHLLRGGREARSRAFAIAQRLGRYAAEQGAPEQAVRFYEAALQALGGGRRKGDANDKLDLLERLGELYMQLGRISEGQRCFLRLLRHPLPAERHAQILWKMGKSLQKSQPRRALRWLRRAQAALQGEKETALLVQILGDTGFVLHLQNRHEAARSCWEAARRATEKIEDPAQRDHLLGFIHSYLAIAAVKRREMVQARYHYDEVLHYWHETKSPVEISKIYNGLGLLAFWQQRFEAAEDYFLRCLGAMERIGNRLDAGRVSANLGLVLQYSNQNRAALPYHERHFQVSREVGDLRGQLYSSLNLGNVHSLLGDFEQAIEYFQRSLEIAKRHGNDFDIFHCRFNLGRIRIRQGAYGEARGHLTGPFKDLPFDYEALRRLYLATIDLETDAYPKAYHTLREIIASFEDGREHSNNQMVRIGCLAEGHAWLIECALRRGDLVTAGKEAEELKEILAMPIMEMLIEPKLHALLTLANLATYRGEGDRAEEALECALKLARGGELRYEEGKILRGMAEFHIASEKEFDAEDACNESLALLESLGARHEVARTWMTKATLLERMYFVEEALDLLHRAAETFQQIGVKYDLARCSQRIAKLLVSRGAREEAAHHQTKAAQLYAAVGCPEEIEPLPEATLH
ncbi:MAG: tetratricopeptide repeat protein, partial [Deltaproteobacteria bacterium]